MALISLRAWLWAKREAKKRNAKPAVVKAVIDVGECLDLLDVHWSHIVRVYHRVMAPSGKPLSTQKPRIVRTEARHSFTIEDMEPTYEERGTGCNRLDCDVFNFTIGALSQDQSIVIDSVRAALSEGHPLYHTSFVDDRSHIQIAIRDTARCIIGKPCLVRTFS